MNVNNYWYAILQSTQVKLSKLLGVIRFGEKLIESDGTECPPEAIARSAVPSCPIAR